jgi:hypothetical protein
MTLDYNFAREDSELYNILDNASPRELQLVVRLLREGEGYDISPDCTEIVEIVDGFQKMGGHEFFNWFNGHGALYLNIVRSVAKELELEVQDSQSVEELEWAIVESVSSRTGQDMNELTSECWLLDIERTLNALLENSDGSTRWDRAKEFSNSPWLLAMAAFPTFGPLLVLGKEVYERNVHLKASQSHTLLGVRLVAGIRVRLMAEQHAQFIGGES